MCNEHKIIHIFIHSQLEDKGHLYAKAFLRSYYDLLLLSKRVNLEKVFSDFSHYRRKSAGFLDVLYNSFGIKSLKRSTPKVYFHLYSARYQLNIRYRLVNLFSSVVIRMFLSYIRNPILALIDKELRKALMRKLADRNWYRKHLGRYVKIFKY